MKTSAGILIYKKSGDKLLFFIVHPGGPFWRNKDDGAWGIPKGEAREDETLFDAAKRELMEETGVKLNNPKKDFFYLGEVEQKSGKRVHCWAFEKNFDGKIDCTSIVRLEINGEPVEFPEIDKGGFFDFRTTEEKINPAQFEFIKKLMKMSSPDKVGKQKKLF